MDMYDATITLNWYLRITIYHFQFFYEITLSLNYQFAYSYQDNANHLLIYIIALAPWAEGKHAIQGVLRLVFLLWHPFSIPGSAASLNCYHHYADLCCTYFLSGAGNRFGRKLFTHPYLVPFSIFTRLFFIIWNNAMEMVRSNIF